MGKNEEAAPGCESGTRLENQKQPLNDSAPALLAQERPVAIWRSLAWPRKFTARCTDTTVRVFDALDRLLAGGDYARLIAVDGRALALVDGGFFEALRRAAYNYSEPLQCAYEWSAHGTMGGAL